MPKQPKQLTYSEQERLVQRNIRAAQEVNYHAVFQNWREHSETPSYQLRVSAALERMKDRLNEVCQTKQVDDVPEGTIPC